MPILADHVARYLRELRPERSPVMREMEELAEREGIPIVHWETGRFLATLVRALDPDEILWFKQESGSLVRVSPDPDGLYRSAFLPGLWLDPEALVRGDTRRLRHVLDQGLAALIQE